MPDEIEFSGEVELFPQEGGWHDVAAPASVSANDADGAERGVIAVTASIGTTTWNTSLLPLGDGSHFVALNAKVRSAEGVSLGGAVTVCVAPRTR